MNANEECHWMTLHLVNHISASIGMPMQYLAHLQTWVCCPVLGHIWHLGRENHAVAYHHHITIGPGNRRRFDFAGLLPGCGDHIGAPVVADFKSTPAREGWVYIIWSKFNMLRLKIFRSRVQTHRRSIPPSVRKRSWSGTIHRYGSPRKDPYPVFEPQSYITTMWLQYLSTRFNLSEEYFTTYNIILINIRIICVCVYYMIHIYIYLIYVWFCQDLPALGSQSTGKGQPQSQRRDSQGRGAMTLVAFGRGCSQNLAIA